MSKTNFMNVKKRLTVNMQPISAEQFSNTLHGVYLKERLFYKIKSIVKKIPLVSSLSRFVYNKLKSISKSTTKKNHEQIVSLNNLLGEKVDTLSLKLDTLSLKLDTLSHKFDSVMSLNGTVAENIVTLHEKLDTYVIMLVNHINLNRPAVSSGDIVAVKLCDFIVGLPAEEWRLVSYSAFNGIHEPGLVKVFRETLSLGMCVVDVGANVGIYTLIAASIIGDSGKIYAFEPTPRTFSILCDNVQVNGYLESERVNLFQKAVSDRKGSSKFFIINKICGHNTLFDIDGSGECINVDTDTLDNLISSQDKVDIIKIDAEGAEPFILRGMSRIIEQNPEIIIFIEFAPEHLSRAGISTDDFLNEITSYGFVVKKILEPTGELVPVSESELRNAVSINLMLQKSEL